MVVEPILTERLIHAEILGYNLRPAPSVESFIGVADLACALDRLPPPMLLVAAWDLGRETAAALVFALRKRADLGAVPLVVLADPAEPSAFAAAERAGAVAVLAKPVRPARLLEVCQGAMAAQIARFPQLPPARAGFGEAS